jgi:hypothetical protein
MTEIEWRAAWAGVNAKFEHGEIADAWTEAERLTLLWGELGRARIRAKESGQTLPPDLTSPTRLASDKFLAYVIWAYGVREVFPDVSEPLPKSRRLP